MTITKTGPALILSVLIFAFVGVAAAQNQQVVARAERTTGDKFTIFVQTSRGANVVSVNRPSADALQAIDNGLTELFAIARRNGYRNRLGYGDYTVYIGKADRTSDPEGKYSPAIAITSAQYAGTVFDKGGFIYVAGLVLSNEPCTFLVPEMTKEFDQLSNYVRYEGEHLILYHNDRRRYSATADHSKGGTHPILQ